MSIEYNKIFHEDALSCLKTFPDESIDCVITSPPYWSLRDYQVNGQLGMEPTYQEYIKKLLLIFDEVKRVLKKEGTCWVNLGDIYVGNGNWANYQKKKDECSINKRIRSRAESLNMSRLTAKIDDIPNKCLLQIPSRFSLAMTERGWVLRNKIIWKKPNCMPISVKDRFTMDYEEIFFFVKSAKYYFKQQFEPWDEDERASGLERAKLYGYDGKETYADWYFNQKEKGKDWTNKKNTKDQRTFNTRFVNHPFGRNKRCVWSIPFQVLSENHFATYPEKLLEPMIMAGCPEDGIVLDPFMGSGTTAVVAKRLKRNWLGIELNPEYIALAEKRIRCTDSALLVEA